MSAAVSNLNAGGPALVVRSAADVCAFVDDLPAGAAGELVFTDDGTSPDGAVFVENGRVCWAAARGLARRLTDLLAASAHVDAAEMESLFGKCQRTRAPLGEYLVGAGIVTVTDLRSALLKHTAESLSALCARDGRPGVQAEWNARSGVGYSSRFTFTTPELLSSTFAESHAALAERATSELASAFDGAEWGAAFVRSASRASPDPIAIHGASPDKSDAVLRLGRWAASSLDVAGGLAEDEAFIATLTDDGAFVAWRVGTVLFAGHTGVRGPARLLNRQARARRSEG